MLRPKSFFTRNPVRGAEWILVAVSAVGRGRIIPIVVPKPVVFDFAALVRTGCELIAGVIERILSVRLIEPRVGSVVEPIAPVSRFARAPLPFAAESIALPVFISADRLLPIHIVNRRRDLVDASTDPLCRALRFVDTTAKSDDEHTTAHNPHEHIQSLPPSFNQAYGTCRLSETGRNGRFSPADRVLGKP